MKAKKISENGKNTEKKENYLSENVTDTHTTNDWAR